MTDQILEPIDDNIQNLGSAEKWVIGQWVWVLEEDEESWNYPERIEGVSKAGEWYGCIDAIGTNYIHVTAPTHDNSTRGVRIHFDNISEVLRAEDGNEQLVLVKYVNHYQDVGQELMLEVQEVCARLGFNPETAMGHAPGGGTDLMVLSGQNNVEEYKGSLIKAQEEELPELFEKIRENNKLLSKWLSAEIVPLESKLSDMKLIKGSIADRIFNVSLYAGLIESVVTIKKGKPAPIHEKLNLMQRKLFMDEECLCNYQSGGMEFEDIDSFDKWVAQKENMERMLPFPRCIVALQVRRDDKRRWTSTLLESFIKINLQKLDKHTFLYIRNGQQVYRLTTELEFDDMIFPDLSIFDPDVPQMMEIFGSSISGFKSVAEYESEVAEKKANERKYKAWEKKNRPMINRAKKVWVSEEHGYGKTFYSPRNPHWDWDRGIRMDNYSRFDSTNVYFDDAVEAQKSIIEKYNRIALIIQGLFDRSEVLHPHPPVQTWTAQGFAAAIDLRYDATMVLTHGDKPDFEEYWNKCNAQITKKSVMTGQDDLWQMKMAEKENNARDRVYDGRGTDSRVDRYKPYGNPGPGVVARMHSLTRTGKARFSWLRDRQTHGGWGYDEEYIPAYFSGKVSLMFNISAYTLGDFKQFFNDPRTRREYVKWAPFLLTAEEYHAGNINPHKPLNTPKIRKRKKPEVVGRKEPESVNQKEEKDWWR